MLQTKTQTGSATPVGTVAPAKIPSWQRNRTPLCIDLDGTLLHTDLFGESIAALLAQKPWLLVALLFWCFQGRAALKQQIARHVHVNASLLPYNDPLIVWLRLQKALGRRLVLATASDRTAVQGIVDHLDLFDDVIASNGRENCKGRVKLEKLRERFGPNFDYIGNSRADLPIWLECRESLVANASTHLLRKVERTARVVHIFERKRHGLRLPMECLRVHQWTKNLLVFVPLLTAHAFTQGELLRNACLSCLSFCCGASGLYILNDITDLEADRRYAGKRDRPFASGRVSVMTGLVVSPLLIGAGLGITLLLPRESFYVLLLYLFLTIVYSCWLKRLLLIDVFVLAALYTIRLLAGRAAYHVELSIWLLSFSMFLFLSLGFCKRVSELSYLRSEHRPEPAQAHGRAYQSTDLEQINIFGVASGFLASFVLLLYMQSHQVRLLYKQPQVLYFLFPLLLYWIARVWILAHRGQMSEDPVLFAIKDKVTWFVGVGTAVLLLCAAHSWIS